MKKEQVLGAFKNYEVYLASLTTSIKTDEDAREPVAEIVLHLAEWGRFIREERLPFIKNKRAFNSYPDVDEFNKNAVKKSDQLNFSDILAHAQKQRALIGKEIEILGMREWEAPFTLRGW